METQKKKREKKKGGTYSVNSQSKIYQKYSGRRLFLHWRVEPLKKLSLRNYFAKTLLLFFIAASHTRGADLVVGSNYTPTDWR